MKTRPELFIFSKGSEASGSSDQIRIELNPEPDNEITKIGEMVPRIEGRIINPEKSDAIRPYPGLRSFTEDDKNVFFGRDTEIEAISELVSKNILTVIYGKSGVGKSSLLYAGLYPKARKQNYFPVTIKFHYKSDGNESVSFIQQIIKAIEEAAKTNHILVMDAFEYTQLQNNPQLKPEFEKIRDITKEEDALWKLFFTKTFWDDENDQVIPVLVFDQFEEIFTKGKGDPRVTQLMAVLANLVELVLPEDFKGSKYRLFISPEKGRYRIIFSLRQEFFPELASLNYIIPSITRNRFLVSNLSKEGALSAVYKPSETSNIIERVQAEKIVNFLIHPSKSKKSSEITDDLNVENNDIEPSFLSLLCYQLNEHRIRKKLKKIDENLLNKYLKEDIIGSYYKSVIRKFFPTVGWFIQNNLIDKEGYRKFVRLETAAKKIGLENVKKLEAFRIIRSDNAQGVKQIELVHDILRSTILKARKRRKLLMRLGIFILMPFAIIILSFIVQVMNYQELADVKYSEKLQTDLDAATSLIDSMYEQLEEKNKQMLYLQLQVNAISTLNDSLKKRLLSNSDFSPDKQHQTVHLNMLRGEVEGNLNLQTISKEPPTIENSNQLRQENVPVFNSPDNTSKQSQNIARHNIVEGRLIDKAAVKAKKLLLVGSGKVHLFNLPGNQGRRIKSIDSGSIIRFKYSTNDGVDFMKSVYSEDRNYLGQSLFYGAWYFIDTTQDKGNGKNKKTVILHGYLHEEGLREVSTLSSEEIQFVFSKLGESIPYLN